MKFNIVYERKFNSIKKALGVYRQLRRGEIKKEDIFFNYNEKANMTFNCKTYNNNNVLVSWANNSIACSYKKIFSNFFVEIGYKGKVGLNARFKC